MRAVVEQNAFGDQRPLRERRQVGLATVQAADDVDLSVKHDAEPLARRRFVEEGRAAVVFDDLARRFPSNQRDAAWKAAKLYEDKLKDKTRAREVYATVPASSSHYGDAQKKLR